MGASKGVLLVNLGTPDSPSVPHVRSYLRQFLNDPLVIDIPWLLRKLLVNLIIVPFRAPKSAEIYRKLWDDRGSPLLYYGEDVRDLVQEKLGDEYEVFLAMRYKNPSMPSVMEKMRQRNFESITIIPLFPQYATASTGSVIKLAEKILAKWDKKPKIRMVKRFFDVKGLIDTIAIRAEEANYKDYDFYIFSYHGLPNRQVIKTHEDGRTCVNCSCEKQYEPDMKDCYKATSYETTRLIVDKLGIPEDKYIVSFQSRLSKNWLTPFSDKVVEEKAKEGVKKLMVFSPAFVADCLETTIEIGDEYNEIFHENGGEELKLVESLNAHPLWIDTLADMVKEEQGEAEPVLLNQS